MHPVGTASARDRAQVEAEINRQHSPDFDQGTVVEPNFIEPNLMLHGGYIFDGDNVSVGFWIEDLAGNTVASSAASGPKGKLFNMVDNAVAALAHDFCHGKPWEGIITVELHDSGRIPHAQDPTKSADYKSDLSITCTFVGDESSECTASSSGSIVGNGASIITDASGTVPAYASVSVANGEVQVKVGVIRIKGTQTVSVGGTTSSGPQDVDLGPYSAKAKASGDSRSESGSVTQGKVVISWSARR